MEEGLGISLNHILFNRKAFSTFFYPVCLFAYPFQNSHILLKFAHQKLNTTKHGNE